MTFFTRDCWASDEADDSVFDRYRKHFDQLRPQLPAAILALDAEHTLHDAQVVSVVLDVANSLELILDGWDQPLQNPIRYKLHCTEVSRFEQRFSSGDGAIQPSDLAYWEVDVVAAGIEMRMLSPKLSSQSSSKR